MRRAFFLLQPEDVYGANQVSVCDYDIIVCNPDFSAGAMARLKEMNSSALLLAYDNFMDAPDPVWQSSYWKAKAALIEPYHVGTTWWKDSPGYFMCEELAIKLAQFHRERTLARGFDGIYIDRMPCAYPARQEPALEFSAYAYRRQFYTAALRRSLGVDAVLMANTLGMLRDPMLNGVSLEMSSHEPLVSMLGAWNAAANLAWPGKRNCCIGWTRNDDEVAQVELLSAIPWMVLGEIRRKPQP